jgi:hypothetical protein
MQFLCTYLMRSGKREALIISDALAGCRENRQVAREVVRSPANFQRVEGGTNAHTITLSVV